MVRVIIVKSPGDFYTVLKVLDRVKKRLPRMTRLGMIKWGKILARDMQLAVEEAGISDSTGTLQGKGIRWEQGVRSDTGYLFMRLYAIYLDSMKTHAVRIHRRRLGLLRWAKRSRKFKRKAGLVERGAISGFYVTVRRHPFIRNGWRRARPKLNPILKRMAARAVQMA